MPGILYLDSYRGHEVFSVLEITPIVDKLCQAASIHVFQHNVDTAILPPPKHIITLNGTGRVQIDVKKKSFDATSSCSVSKMTLLCFEQVRNSHHSLLLLYNSSCWSHTRTEISAPIRTQQPDLAHHKARAKLTVSSPHNRRIVFAFTCSGDYLDKNLPRLKKKKKNQQRDRFPWGRL